MLDQIIKAIILGIVEGVTEFLPISSTGHLILVGSFLGFTGDFAKVFEVFIQLGAILAVVWLYRAELLSLAKRLPNDKQAQRFVLSVLVAFLPAAVIGLVFRKSIKALFDAPQIVAVSLLVGGILIVLLELRKYVTRLHELEKVPLSAALNVGIAQVLSLVPGVSRSATSIFGGLLSGMDRSTATQFSFFLAIPVLFAASLFDLVSSRDALRGSGNLLVLAVGFVVSFVVALAVVRWLLRYISRNDFRIFGYYRIVIGVVILALFATGILKG